MGIAEDSSFHLEEIDCGLKIVTPEFQGSGSNVYTEFNFGIQNDCPAALTFNSLQPFWSGTNALPKIDRLTRGGTQIFANVVGVDSGTEITFTAISVPANSTYSQRLEFEFTTNFTNLGTRFGTPGQFDSILANVTAPFTEQIEIVDTPPVP